VRWKRRRIWKGGVRGSRRGARNRKILISVNRFARDGPRTARVRPLPPSPLTPIGFAYFSRELVVPASHSARRRCNFTSTAATPSAVRPSPPTPIIAPENQRRSCALVSMIRDETRERLCPSPLMGTRAEFAS